VTGVRRGIGSGADDIRRRDANQADSSGLSYRGSVVIGRSGDLDVKTDASIERLPDGTLRVAKRRMNVAPLRDFTQGVSLAVDQVPDLPDLGATPASATILRDDIQSNLVPALRAQVATLTAKVNELLEALR